MVFVKRIGSNRALRPGIKPSRALNVIVAESPRVMFEAQPAQPHRHIHKSRQQ
jgi:hypothetical protein